MKRGNKLWIGLFALLGLVLSIQLIASNLSAGKGEQLSVLEKRAQNLSRENQSLAQEAALGSSLTNLSEKATESGFAKPENILYLDTSIPVAQAK